MIGALFAGPIVQAIGASDRRQPILGTLFFSSQHNRRLGTADPCWPVASSPYVFAFGPPSNFEGLPIFPDGHSHDTS
jgi:hypothetical protein